MDKNENYTPPWFIEKVKKVLGSIDLDPMSCDIANNYKIKAKKYFTKEISCFENYWGEPKTVFMNPPYSAGEYKPAILHFLNEYFRADFEAIVLTNNNTDTDASQRLMNESSAVCFPNKRISYLDENMLERKGNRYAQMVTYFGRDKQKFKETFESIGVVLFNPLFII